MGIDPQKVEAYEKHAADLMRLASVLVGPPDAEDVVADAMVRVFTRPTTETVDHALA